MSTITRIGEGRGYSQREALLDWLTNDETLRAEGISFGQEALVTTEPITVEELVSPRRAKRIHTDTFPQKGQRKFVTSYYVWDNVVESKVEFNLDCNLHLNIATDKVNTGVYFRRQMDAIAAAKELSKHTHQSYEIIIAKVLVSGNSTVAKITPGKSRPGTYKFTGQLKY